MASSVENKFAFGSGALGKREENNETKEEKVNPTKSVESVEEYDNLDEEYVDIIQIGARNMYNYELLKEVGKLQTPVILKRNMCASYQEWLLAAEYILKEGNKNIILCERGIKNCISEETRNVLDIQAIPYIKKQTNFEI